MKNYFSANPKFALNVLLAALVFNLFLSETALSQRPQSVTARVGSSKANVNYSKGGDEYEIYSLVNNERRRKRLKNLDWDNDLARLARKYSQQMAKGNFFSHYDKNGDSVVERASSAKIFHSGIGENLFMCGGIDDFNAFAVKGWMNSSSHRQNILNRNWTATGIGIAEARDGKIYITQVFITR